ncbi:MAG: peptidoglycan DD-metalloendopeptidase family protein [Candidatus Magasanikbacteria bacterium]|nr:peptidoglycan DD-metalloendopeptidase family protein [Candidatus Magasanikbacteria bacterium]
MKYRLIVLFFIVLGLLFFSPSFVYSDNTAVGGNKEEIDDLNAQIAEKKDKIKQLEETIGNYKKNIEQKQLEAVSLKNQLSILDNRRAQTEADIKLTNERINQAKLEIEALELNIQDKEASIARQKKIIAKIVRNIHAEDQKNYLEILLTSDTFADFYNQAKYLESVYTDLGQSVKNLRIAKEDLDAKKAQVEAKKKTYEDLKAELENKQKDLIDQTNTKENLLTATHSSEQKYRILLESLRKQYQAIEGEVRTYEDQVRKKLEEMQRFKDLGDSAGVLGWPVSSRYITSAFHDPDYPYRRVFEHSGIDLRAAHGSPIKAAAAGYVARAKRCSSASCYSYVLLVHTGNLSTVYGHMSSISVSEDEFVSKGDIIGYTGGTPGTVGAGPFVTGPHLHFEVRANGIPVNPMGYLQ